MSLLPLGSSTWGLAGYAKVVEGLSDLRRYIQLTTQTPWVIECSLQAAVQGRALNRHRVLALGDLQACVLTYTQLPDQVAHASFDG